MVLGPDGSGGEHLHLLLFLTGYQRLVLVELKTQFYQNPARNEIKYHKSV